MRHHFTLSKPLNSLRICALLLGASAVFFSGGRTAAAEKVYSLGVVPQQSATRLAQIWIPFLDRLERETGYKFKFATAKDIPTFEACLSDQAYDFAYMNPYHYTVVHETAGYEAFAHQADKKLKGILVTRSDSSVAALEDLDGYTLAFPSPAAFGASVVPRAELSAAGVSFEAAYVKSHDSVYRAVALGVFPAGGGVLRTFGNLPEDLKSQLRVFYRTEGYTPHAFAAAPAVPADVRETVAAAMTGLDDDAVLGALGMSGFVPAGDAAWDDVRALNLTAGQTEIASAGEETCHSN
ncbi:phosphate/phosphite/phosphonate ABC transporter substrate-binding protein [Roseibium sp.]|uniref:phosphate/phosphite/phosphonate ABC transporter substrate-binding protein n=1 Tax=Roseibium sp. TaxID=1936156 RepID=UPI00326574BD